MKKYIKSIICLIIGHHYGSWYSEYSQTGEQKVNFFCSRCGKDEFTARERMKEKSKNK